MSKEEWDQYFMRVAQPVSSRSTCTRRQIGAIAVKDKRILATGYNGAPSGLEHCLDNGCLRDKMEVPSGQRQELCMAVHAEQNVLIQAAVNGVALKNATLYVTESPCILCAKMLINAGIKRIVFQGQYPDHMGVELLKEAGISVKQSN